MADLRLDVKLNLDSTAALQELRQVKSAIGGLEANRANGPVLDTLGSRVRGTQHSLDAMRGEAEAEIDRLTRRERKRLSRRGPDGRFGYEVAATRLSQSDPTFDLEVRDLITRHTTRTGHAPQYRDMARQAVYSRLDRRDSTYLGVMGGLSPQGDRRGEAAVIRELLDLRTKLNKAEQEALNTQQKLTNAAARHAQQELTALRAKETTVRQKLTAEQRMQQTLVDKAARGYADQIAGRQTPLAAQHGGAYHARMDKLRGARRDVENKAVESYLGGDYQQAEFYQNRAAQLQAAEDRAAQKVAQAASKEAQRQARVGRATAHVGDSAVRRGVSNPLEGLLGRIRESNLTPDDRSAVASQIEAGFSKLDRRIDRYNNRINVARNRGDIEEESRLTSRRDALETNRSTYRARYNRALNDVSGFASDRDAALNQGSELSKALQLLRDPSRLHKLGAAEFGAANDTLSGGIYGLRRLSRAKNLSGTEQEVLNGVLKALNLTNRSELDGVVSQIHSGAASEATARGRAGAFGGLRQFAPALFGGVAAGGGGGGRINVMSAYGGNPLGAFNNMAGRAALLGGMSIYGLGAAGAGVGALASTMGLAAESETQKNAIAGMVAAYTEFVDLQGRSISAQEQFNRAVEYSRDVYKDIREDAVKTILTTREMMEYFQAGAPMLMGRGQSIDQSRELVRDIAVMGKTLGYEQQAILSDVRDYSMGRVNTRTQTAFSIGLDPAKYNAAYRSDPTAAFDMLRSAFGGFRKSIERQEELPAATFSRFKDTLQQTGIEAGARAFLVMEDTINRLTKQLEEGNGPMVDFVENIAKLADGLIRAGEELAPILGQLDVSNPANLAVAGGSAFVGYNGLMSVGGGANALLGAAASLGGPANLRDAMALARQGGSLTGMQTAAVSQAAQGLQSLSAGFAAATMALALFTNTLYDAGEANKKEAINKLDELSKERRAFKGLADLSPEGRRRADTAIQAFLETGTLRPPAVSAVNNDALRQRALLDERRARGLGFQDALPHVLGQAGIYTAGGAAGGALVAGPPGALVGGILGLVGGGAKGAFDADRTFLASEYAALARQVNVAEDVNPAALKAVADAFDSAYAKSPASEQARLKELQAIVGLGINDPRRAAYSNSQLQAATSELQSLRSTITYRGLKEAYGAEYADSLSRTIPMLKENREVRLQDEQSAAMAALGASKFELMGLAQTISATPSFQFSTRRSLADAMYAAQTSEAQAQFALASTTAEPGSPEATQAVQQFEQTIVQAQLARLQEIAAIQQGEEARRVEIKLLQERNRLANDELRLRRQQFSLDTQFQTGQLGFSGYLSQTLSTQNALGAAQDRSAVASINAAVERSQVTASAFTVTGGAGTPVIGTNFTFDGTKFISLPGTQSMGDLGPMAPSDADYAPLDPSGSSNFSQVSKAGPSQASSGGLGLVGLKGNASTYAPLISAAARRHGLEPAVLMALIEKESSFNPNARGSAGEIGLGQIKPATAKELGIDPYNVRDNIEGAAKYLSQLTKRFGSVEKGLRAYNQGPTGAFKNTGRYPNSVARGQSYAADVLRRSGQYTPGERRITPANQQNTPPVPERANDLTQAQAYVRNAMAKAGIRDGSAPWAALGKVLEEEASMLTLPEIAAITDEAIRQINATPTTTKIGASLTEQVQGRQSNFGAVFSEIAKKKYPARFGRVDPPAPADSGTAETFYQPPSVAQTTTRVTDELMLGSADTERVKRNQEAFERAQRQMALIEQVYQAGLEQGMFEPQARQRLRLQQAGATSLADLMQAQAAEALFNQVTLPMRELDARRLSLTSQYAFRGSDRNSAYFGMSAEAAEAQHTQDIDQIRFAQQALTLRGAEIGSNIPAQVRQFAARDAQLGFNLARRLDSRQMTAQSVLARRGLFGETGAVQELQIQADEVRRRGQMAAQQEIDQTNINLMRMNPVVAEMYGTQIRAGAQDRAQALTTQAEGDAQTLMAQAALLARTFASVRETADAMSQSLADAGDAALTEYLNARGRGSRGAPAPTGQELFDRETALRQDRMFDGMGLEQARARQGLEMAARLQMSLAGRTPEEMAAFLSSPEFGARLQQSDLDIRLGRQRRFMSAQGQADLALPGIMARDRVLASTLAGSSALLQDPFALMASGYDGRLSFGQSVAQPFLAYQTQANQNQVAALAQSLMGSLSGEQASAAGYRPMNIFGLQRYATEDGRLVNEGQMRSELLRTQGYNVGGMALGQFLGQAVGGSGSGASAQFGAQLGGLLGPSVLGGLGAFGGPAGMVLGGLLGGVFGRRGNSQEEQERRRWQRSVEDILSRIDQSLRPVRDVAQTIKGEALFGRASAYVSGRAGVVENLNMGAV